jgi:hypothetical protein
VTGPLERHRTIADCALIVVVVLVSCAPYVTRLGLYADDWANLGWFRGTADQAFIGLFKSSYAADSGQWIRPVQTAYFAAQFKAFGLNPLGYHVANNLMLCAAVVLLFLVCRRMAVPRGVALAIAFVYGLAPHYSSDRFWYAASMANLCIALTLASFLLALAARKTARPGRRAACACGSLLAMVAGVLAYEITMPMLLLVLVVLLYQTRIAAAANRSRDYAFVLASVVVVAGVFAFKFGLQQRTTWRLQFLQHLPQVVTHALIQTATFNFGSYGLLLPAKVLAIARLGMPWWTYAVPGLVGVVVSVCVHAASRAARREDEPPSFWWRLGAAGLLVFGASYVPFAADPTLDLAVGPNNRVAAAAAIGAALSMTAIIGLLVCVVVRRHAAARGLVLASGIGLLCAAECLVTLTLAENWVEASRRQQPILAGIREQFPRLEPGTVILLDGACPYVGPGIVFEGAWDLASALRLESGQDGIEADLIRPGVEVRADGIMLRSFAVENLYRFGPQLIVYDHPRKRTQVLSDFAVAQKYFGVERSVAPCPPSRQGVGVQLF